MSKTALMIARLAGALTLVIGIAYAFGYGVLLHVHMLTGSALVLALWALVLAGFRASPRLAVLAFGWGLILPMFGIAQFRLLPGDYHWVVQAIHVLIGLGAMAQAERLGAAIKRREAGTAAR